jgi:hypothetical protein
MTELFRLESELVKNIAKYNLAKVNESTELMHVVTEMHNLIDEYERTVCGEVQLSSDGINKRNRPTSHEHEELNIAQALGCKIQSNVEPKSHSAANVTLPSDKANTISATPQNWHTLSLEERIAHRQTHEEPKVEQVKVSQALTANIGRRVEESTEVLEDKFDLTEKGYSDEF